MGSKINEHLLGLLCPRCGYEPDIADPTNFRGCAKCHMDLSVPINYVAATPDLNRGLFQSASCADPVLGIWRWGPLLPVRPAAPTSLGEANTPVIWLGDHALNTHDRRIVLKNEAGNPTSSHKDRLSAMAVAAAALLGNDTVAAASSGNHGASLAAYAARAGMRCVIATMSSVPTAMHTFMKVYGADVHTFDDLEKRYDLIESGGLVSGWFVCSNACSPPVGSPAYGVDGYKTIAYELWEQIPDQRIGAVVASRQDTGIVLAASPEGLPICTPSA